MNNLSFNTKLASAYKSSSQKVRILSEDWLSREGFCPACSGQNLLQVPNNRPVLDFICPDCSESFELKSKKGGIGSKILDGAYNTMVDRLASETNPNLFLLNYKPDVLEVDNFFVIPKHFFIVEIIEKRKPLGIKARRSGWVGCNILLNPIPEAGRIYIVRNGRLIVPQDVVRAWKQTLFLRKETTELKGWIFSVMRCIDSIRNSEFKLDEIYMFEDVLKMKYPNNRHIKDKIRQQLQYLRDFGYLEFVGRGKYKKIKEGERYAKI